MLPPRTLLRYARAGATLLAAYPAHLTGRRWTRPLSVNLLVTARCTSRCLTCDSWRLGGRERELSLDDYRRLAAEIADLGALFVTVGGGEPTVRRDVWAIVEALKRAGLEVQLTTNGCALGPAQRRRLYASGLDRVTFSVDSHVPEVYARLRGVDALARVLGHLAAVLEERPAHLQVDTNTVLCRENAASFLATLDYLLARGVPLVNFSAVTIDPSNFLLTASKADLAAVPPALLEAIVTGLLARKRRTAAIGPSSAFIRGLPRYFAAPARPVYPCLAGYLTLDVLHDGSVHGCGNLPAFGNVRTASLRDLWCGEPAARSRAAMAAGRCTGCYLSCKAELAIAANPRYGARLALERLKVLRRCAPR